MPHYCYILQTLDRKYTYNGYTNNLVRRLRQHCGEIAGGARATISKVGIGWEYIAQITSDDPNFTKEKALSLEWHIRYPTGRRPRPREYNGPSGRIRALNLVFAHPKFNQIHFTCAILPEYIDLVNANATNTTIIALEPDCKLYVPHVDEPTTKVLENS